MRTILLFLGMLLLPGSTFAQITLTQQDVLAWFTQGTTLRWEETAVQPVTVGTASSSAQTFDFSALQFQHRFYDYDSYFTLANSPGDTTWPHARAFDAGFGNAPYAEYFITPTGFGYIYFDLKDTGLFETGFVSTDYTAPGVLGFVDTLPSIPPEPIYTFPFTVGSHWLYVSVPDTSSLGMISWDTTTVVCDAFGTLVLNTGNGPVTYNCLRITQTEAFMTYDTASKTTYRTFNAYHQYITKEGINVTVSIDSADLASASVTPIAVSAYFNPVPANGVLRSRGPSTFAIENYPNPFTTVTTLQYSVPGAGPVTLEVYNAIGQRMVTLASGEERAGTHYAVFHRQGLPNGTYFYRLRTGTGIQCGSMTCGN